MNHSVHNQVRKQTAGLRAAAALCVVGIALEILLLPFGLFASGAASIQNVVITPSCYTPGGTVNVSFQVNNNAGSGTDSVYGDIVWSNGTTAVWNDDSMVDNNGNNATPDTAGHTGATFANTPAGGTWTNVAYTINVPSTYTGAKYLIIDLRDDYYSLQQYSTSGFDAHFVNAMSKCPSGCGTGYMSNTGYNSFRASNAVCVFVVSPTSTVTPTYTSTSTVTPTDTDTVTPTFTSTVTPTFTSSVTPTNTSTSTVTPTYTSTVTPTSTGTSTITPTSSSTVTPTSSRTVTPTNTPTSTVTPTYSSTVTPTSTDTSTSTVTPTFSSTVTTTNTSTSTVTPTYTSTVSPTSTDTSTSTVTPTFSSTVTPTNTSTSTVTPT